MYEREPMIERLETEYQYIWKAYEYYVDRAGETVWDLDYGYPVNHRFRALAYANVLGFDEAVSRYNVGHSTLYRWRKQLEARGIVL